MYKTSIDNVLFFFLIFCLLVETLGLFELCVVNELNETIFKRKGEAQHIMQEINIIV